MPKAETQFKKGKSGNPSGRPKIVGEIRDLARQHAPAAFERVIELVADADPRVALAAAQEVLNRAYGKPIQAVEGKLEETIRIERIERVLIEPKPVVELEAEEVRTTEH